MTCLCHCCSNNVEVLRSILSDVPFGFLQLCSHVPWKRPLLIISLTLSNSHSSGILRATPSSCWSSFSVYLLKRWLNYTLLLMTNRPTPWIDSLGKFHRHRDPRVDSFFALVGVGLCRMASEGRLQKGLYERSFVPERKSCLPQRGHRRPRSQYLAKERMRSMVEAFGGPWTYKMS